MLIGKEKKVISLTNSLFLAVALSLFGPSSLAYSQAGSKILEDALNLVCTKARKMSSGEINEARKVYNNSINYNQIKICDSIGGGNRPYVHNAINGYWINVGKTNYPNLLANSSLRQTLIHELAHVWQGQRNIPYVFNSLAHQAGSYLNSGSPNGAYSYTPGSNWKTYNVEQQASIIQRWYASGMKTNCEDPLFPYIRDNVRARKPNAITKFEGCPSERTVVAPQWDVSKSTNGKLITSAGKHFFHFHFKVNSGVMPSKTPINVFFNTKKNPPQGHLMTANDIKSVNIMTTISGHRKQSSINAGFSGSHVGFRLPRSLEQGDHLSVRVFVNASKKICDAAAVVNRQNFIGGETSLANNVSFIDGKMCN